MKSLLTEINDDVKDLVKMGFELTAAPADYVPNDEDPGLTFESGQNKKAKLIDTCILYADIRSSTELSKKHSKEVMARLYTAFVSSASYAAHHHGGTIRNIIGDRVMVVFPKNNCFTNAIDTAISINTIASGIIDKHFNGFDFKVGIGIDYGQMKVIKTGIVKQGKERSSHKNLVWIGNPANIASKLADVANKEIKAVYRVTRHPDNPKAWRPKITSGQLPPKVSFPITGQRERVPNEPLYLSTTEVVDMTAEEFAGSISQNPDGTISTIKGKMIKFEKEEAKSIAAPILMTQKVWEEYKSANSSRKDVTEQYWHLQTVKAKEYSGQIWGSGVYWSTINDIKL